MKYKMTVYDENMKIKIKTKAKNTWVKSVDF